VEAFIAYTKFSHVNELKVTLECWEKAGAEPIAVSISANQAKYELERRVVAENMSQGDYILADLCCVPDDLNFVPTAEILLREFPKVGIMAAYPGLGVWVCRKGVIDKWPQKQTTFYAKEHEEAYQRKGYEAALCQELKYVRLPVH
jgi:hypothetical protein